MSTSSATSGRTVTASAKSSEKKVVMRELEKKLKGRQTPLMESPKSSPKSLSVKQVINENMLAARARWLGQNKEKDEEVDISASLSCCGSGSGESDIEEIRGQRQAKSHEPSKNLRLDNNKNIEPNETRGFSNSVPNAKTLQILPPPTNDSGGLSYSMTSKAAALVSEPKIYREGKQSSEGAKKQSSISSTSSAVKKLFGFKTKNKRKRTRKMTRIAPTRVGSVKGVDSVKKEDVGRENLVMEKSKSDSSIVVKKVRAFTSSVEDDAINVSSHGYQNVFDNPQFAKYTQQHQEKHESRSNTSSPSDNATLLQTKKPKPLPRPNMPGSTMERCSIGSDQEPGLALPTTTVPPLTISSMMASSPNSAHPDCLNRVRSLTQNFAEGIEITGVRFICDSDNSLGKNNSGSCSRSGSMEPKERLGKTVSYNPDSMVMPRGGSQKKKELRRGICSDGDQNEFDLEDDYIEMKSICLFGENTPSSVSTDTKKESDFYLEILPNLHELEPKKKLPPIKAQSKIVTPSGDSKESIKPEKPSPLAKQLNKVNSVPSISINTTRNVNTSIVLDKLPAQEGYAEGSKSTHSATPPKSSPMVSKSDDNQELLKPSRKFQYAPVMVEAGKQSKQSDPKTFRYQTVTLGNENKKRKVTEEDILDEKVKTPTESTDGEHPKVKHHPLVNLSSGARRSPKPSIGAERSNYVNRDSLVVMENSMNLHTTMFSTVDPITGKVEWHEYVEMDEDEIDRLATSIGMVKPASTPDKLETLLNLKPREPPCQDVSKGSIENSDLSCDSTSSVSSDCKYILNLNEPPTVPSRPENLDELVDQLKEQSSEDYSYAFTPGMGARWKMKRTVCTTSPTSKANNSICPITIVEDTVEKSNESVMAVPQVKASISASKSVQLDTKPKTPSLPPRTESLLREQELVFKKKSGSQLFFSPLVKTKEKHKTKSFPSKSPPNLQLSPDMLKPLGQSTVSYSKEDTQAQDNLPRRRNNPPKPIPYKEHQKQRLQGKTTTSALLLNDSPIKQEMVRITETRKSVGRSTAHKKLARQRSHRTNKGRISNHKSSSQQKEELEKASVRPPSGQSNFDRQSSHQKQNLSQGSEFDLNLNRESMAILVQNQDAITKELFASRTESEHFAEGNESALERNETEASQKVRDLSNILVELRHLLKSNDFSEKDILSAIESHLKLTHKTGNGKKERNGNEESVEEGTVEEESFEQDSDNYDEEEEGLSGDEPESDIEVGEICEPTGFDHGRPFYVNFQVFEEEPELKPNEFEDIELKLEKASRVFSSESCEEEGCNQSSYINSELWTRGKIEKNDDQRHCYSSSDIETNLDRAVRSPRTPVPNSKVSEGEVSPYVDTSAAPTDHTSYTSSQSSSLSDGWRERSMTAVSYSSQIQNEHQKPTPRSSRAHSNPNLELVDAVVAAEAISNYQSSISSVKPRPQKYKEYLQSRRSEKTFSYCLALQMEDRRLSQAAEINTYNIFSDVIEEETNGDMTNNASSKSLQRVNALARKRPKGAVISNTGRGTFTSKGGRLTKEGSNITIEIPEGAIPAGNSQKLWFDVVQNVYDPSSKKDSSILPKDSTGATHIESLLQEKKDKQVELSPMIVVGPSDAILECPLIIRMPHCLSYRNNSWHLQMLGQSQNGEEQEWSEIINTIGLVLLPARSKSKFYNHSTYQMHIDYVQIKTSQLGAFKLVGRPIRNGTYAAKKMVASVYVKALPEVECVQIDIFISNAIEDQSYALDQSLISHDHIPLLKDMPILCFGDGKDMEVTLSNDSNYATPLGTKAIPFGQIWRGIKVGSSHVTFEVQDILVQDDRALTLKVQQAGSNLYHEANFLLQQDL